MRGVRPIAPVRLLPGFKTWAYTASGPMVPGLPRLTALRLMQSAAELDLVFSWLGRNGVLQIQRTTSLRIFLGSSHCWPASMLGTRYRGLHSRLPGLCSATLLPGRPGRGLSGRGPTRGPFFLLTHRAPALHCGTKHTGEGGFLALQGAQGTWVSWDARVPITVPWTSSRSACPSCWVRLLSHAQSAGARWVPPVVSRPGSLPESRLFSPTPAGLPFQFSHKNRFKGFKYFISLF